jgi:integrase
MGARKRNGSVRWREKNRKYVIDFYDSLGKRHVETIGTNWRDANRKLDERMNEVNSGIYSPDAKNRTFRDFTRNWFKGKVKIKPATLISYGGIIENHLIPYFGDAKLANITRANIRDFVKAKEDEQRPSPKTIHNILLLLHQILADAQVEGILIRNPFLKIERPRIEKEEMDFLKTEEIPVLLEKCDALNYPWIYTAIFTGMRRGELLSLKWEDIDWHSGKIHVRRNLYRGNFQTPKSKRSKRAIDMGPRLAQVLKTHRAKQNEIRLKAGSEWVDNDLIFCQKNGTPLDPYNQNHRAFKPILKKAGIRQIRIHDLRHTFASILIAAGHNPKYIQNQMGHASISITMDLYGHLMPEVHKGAAEKSESLVFGDKLHSGDTAVTYKEKGVTANV